MVIQLAIKRVFLTLLIVSIAASAALGVAAIASPRSWFMQEELVLTAVFTALYSLAALGASIPFDRGHWPIVSGGAIVVIISGLGLTLLALWIGQLEHSDTYLRFVGVVATVGGLLALGSLISMARLSRSLRWLQLLTLVSALFLATTIIAMIIIDPSYPASEHWETLIGLSVVLVACGSIVVPIAHEL